MPASSAMRASLTLSGQLPDQRSATLVTARPDEQLAPNRPILSALPLYMAVRCCMEAVGASTGVPSALCGQVLQPPSIAKAYGRKQYPQAKLVWPQRIDMVGDRCIS